MASSGLSQTPCVALVTDETAPRPPEGCAAVKNSLQDIAVYCEKGHDGGLPQASIFFNFTFLNGFYKYLCLLYLRIAPGRGPGTGHLVVSAHLRP